MKTCQHLSLIAVLFLLNTVSPLKASLTLVGAGNYAGVNLVNNGSFEIGHPGPGNANYQMWAVGSAGTPFLSIPGWNGTGQPSTYAVWGSDQTSGPFHTEASDVLPDGQIGVYFGNGGFLPGQQNTVNLAPTFNPDFTVSFSGSPTFNVFYGGPAVLAQTIPTQLNPAPLYGLSFWASGEGAQFNTSDIRGIFALRVSNTLPGDPLLYLWVPPGGGPIGASHVYQFEFTPLNPLQPVTVEFINYGHLDLSAYGGAFFTTELVLDDVRVVGLPEPSPFALLAAGTIMARLVLRRLQSGRFKASA